MQKGAQKPSKDEKHLFKVLNIAIQNVICLMINVCFYSCSQWIKDSYSYYDALRRSEQAPKAGVSLLSGYIFSSVDQSIVQVGYLMIM
jgi:hypothetical protein